MSDVNRELSSFTSALADELEDTLLEWQPVPDLAAVVERARELSSGTVDEASVVHAKQLDMTADVDPPWHHPRATVRHWHELAPFRKDLRREIETQLDGQVLSAHAGRQPTLGGLRRRSWKVPVAARYVAVAVAACAAIVWFGSSWVAALGERTQNDAVHAASLRAEDDGTWEAATTRQARTKRVAARVPSVVPSVDEPELELEQVLDVVTGEIEADDREKGPTPAVQSIDERIEELDARARQQWTAGDLAAAEHSLRKLVQLGGRRPRVELAYGDLFTLLRQQGKASPLDAAWHRYLRVFPRGRFAEDARAGLCHRASSEGARVCWREYLERHPQGVHRLEARRVLDRVPE